MKTENDKENLITKEKKQKVSMFKEELQQLLVKHGAKLEWAQIKICGGVVDFS